jgi:hypothetical protein
VGGKTPTFWWAMVSCALMAVGGFGPWVTVLGISVSGTEGDGWIVILAAAAAACLVFWHDRKPSLWLLGAAALAGAAGFAVAAYDWARLESVASDSQEQLEGLFDLSVSTGWGIVLCTVASASLVAAIVVHYFSFNAGAFSLARELSSNVGQDPS